MNGIFTYIYHKNQLNVGKLTYMDGMGSGLARIPDAVKGR